MLKNFSSSHTNYVVGLTTGRQLAGAHVAKATAIKRISQVLLEVSLDVLPEFRGVLLRSAVYLLHRVQSSVDSTVESVVIEALALAVGGETS